MLKSSICLITVLLILSSCTQTGSNKNVRDSAREFDQASRNSSYDEVKESAEQVQRSLKEREEMEPMRFVKLVDGTYRKNILGEFVLEGYIANYASEATFKDAVIEVRFYTKTNTLLGTKKVSIIEFFDPGKQKRFKKKVYGPDGAKQAGMSVVSVGVSR